MPITNTKRLPPQKAPPEQQAPPETFAQGVMRRLLRRPAALVGLVLLLLVVATALLAPWIAPFDPARQGVGRPFSPPSLQHLFGTDNFGRDVLSRVIYGGRISLQVGLIAVAIGAAGGLVLGAVAGYGGAWADEIVMRFIDFMLAFPGILLAVVVVTTLGPGLQNLMLAVGIGAIPAFARVVRAAVLEVKERDFVVAARALGASDFKLVLRHILPNILPPFSVLVTLEVANAILAGTGLSYLGLGAKPPIPEWGLMLSGSRDFIRIAWWAGTFPGLAITVTVIGINLVGDALRDALDPRLRGTR